MRNLVFGKPDCLIINTQRIVLYSAEILLFIPLLHPIEILSRLYLILLFYNMLWTLFFSSITRQEAWFDLHALLSSHRNH